MDSIQNVIRLFEQYGLPMMAAVFFCEYLNLPGFPAGIIMPAVGVLIAQSGHNLILCIFVSVLAGLIGSIVMYGICYFGGAPLLNKFFGKSKKFHDFVNQCHKRLEHGGGKALMICRLIPMLRTIVSIPAGLLQMDIREYIIYSSIGITIWNTVLICFGYFFSEAFLSGAFGVLIS